MPPPWNFLKGPYLFMWARFGRSASTTPIFFPYLFDTLCTSLLMCLYISCLLWQQIKLDSWFVLYGFGIPMTTRWERNIRNWKKERPTKFICKSFMQRNRIVLSSPWEILNQRLCINKIPEILELSWLFLLSDDNTTNTCVPVDS